MYNVLNYLDLLSPFLKSSVVLLGLLYAHSVIYLKEHTLFQVVAQLWTSDLCICFKVLGVGLLFLFLCFVWFLNDFRIWIG